MENNQNLMEEFSGLIKEVCVEIFKEVDQGMRPTLQQLSKQNSQIDELIKKHIENHSSDIQKMMRSLEALNNKMDVDHDNFQTQIFKNNSDLTTSIIDNTSKIVTNISDSSQQIKNSIVSSLAKLVEDNKRNTTSTLSNQREIAQNINKELKNGFLMAESAMGKYANINNSQISNLIVLINANHTKIRKYLFLIIIFLLVCSGVIAYLIIRF